MVIGQVVPHFSDDVAKRYFRDVVLGLEFCNALLLIVVHYKRIIHCDIKPENLLLTSEGFVQITDFGISHMFEDGDKKDTLAIKNTSPLYTSPCSLQGK